MSTRPADPAAPRTGAILLYFGVLTVLVYLVVPTGFLFDIPSSYILKNKLHATATQVSIFRLVSATPVYVAFVFGLVRDLWSPFGLRDRGYLLTFAPLTAVAYAWMAIAPPTYAGLLVGTLASMTAFYFVMAAYQALIALIGQEKLMTGRLSTLWKALFMIVTFAGALSSGFVTQHLTAKQFFELMIVLVALIGAMGFWKPRAIFTHAYDAPVARGSTFVGDLARLVRHRAIYPAILIEFLWNFMPGANTPLQFHLTNTLHATDAIYAYYNGVFYVTYLPAVIAYGVLCKRMPMRRLLWWGTIIGVPSMIPLAFVETGWGAVWAAVPMGLMSGLASVAFLDLAIRSCPPGLQGTFMMLLAGGIRLSDRGSDLLGSWIYGLSPTHGFTYCVVAMTFVYALMLPVVASVPKSITATAEGEASDEVDAQVRAETSAA